MKNGFWKWPIPGISIAVLILGAIPGSVVLRFMGDPAKNTYFFVNATYYSLINIGYGNIFPALTIVFALASGIKAVRMLLQKSTLRGLFTISVAAMACASLTVYWGDGTALSWTIFLLLCVQVLLTWLLNGKRGDAV